MRPFCVPTRLLATVRGLVVPHRRRIAHGIAVGVVMGSGVACGGGGDAGGTTPIKPPTVRAVQITPAATTIRTAESQQLSATVDADAGVSSAVTWSSDNAAIATVSSGGLVTGVSTGTVTIRAKAVADPTVVGTAAVTVTIQRGIAINPSVVNLSTGGTQTLQAVVTMEPGGNTAVTWRSAATTIATVSAAGLVTGVAVGSTTITGILTADTLLRATATINVIPGVRTITVTPTTVSTFINSTQNLTATVTADASVSTAVLWRSSNAAVATVSTTGAVTGVALGSATITALAAADTTKRATATITVAPRPITVVIPQRLVGLNPGTSSTLTAVVSGDPGINTAVTWSSSNAAIASVSASGVVTASSVGSTLISAALQSDATKRDTVTVTVIPRLPAIWSGARLSGALYDDLVAIAPLSATLAYAVNSINGGTAGGDLYRWDGTSWTRTISGATYNTRFLAVHASASNNVIAVGTNGVIVRFDGTSWSAMPSGTTRTLRSVWVENATTATIVGDNGTALRLNGSTWSSSTTGTTAQLNGVWSGNGAIVAVGAAGVALRFANSTWTRYTAPISDDLLAVAGTASGAVVAVGTYGAITSFANNTWTLISSNGIGDDLTTITGSDANAGRFYIGGSNGVYQLNGTTITSATAPYPVSVFSVALDPAGALWTGGQRGAIQRLTGSTWETLNLAPDLLDVWSTSATNAWAVGDYGFIYRWNGTSWSRASAPSLATLYTVWGTSATNAFAAGDNGTMLRWNGTSWTSMTFPSSARVFALWGSSATNVFAVTDAGEIVRFNGTTWAVQATAPGSASLLAIFGVSATEAYATGINGLVMRYDGTTWSTMASAPATSTLYGIWMTGSTSLLTVGANATGTSGVGYSSTGSSWQSLSLGTVGALTSIWGPSAMDLFATGDGGVLLRNTGSGWNRVTTGVTDLLWSLSSAPDGTGGAFAVGINGLVVTASGPSAISAASPFAGTSAAAWQDLEPSAAAKRDPKASGAASRRGALRRRPMR